MRKTIGFAASFLIVATGSAAASEAGKEQHLLGFWEHHIDFGTSLAGELTIVKTVAGWEASIAGRKVTTSELNINFGASEGRFVGKSSNDGRSLHGWWYQPPGPSGQAYATIVRLKRVARNRWVGPVSPLPQTFALSAKIWPAPSGELRAAFHNREYNMNGGAPQFSVKTGALPKLEFVATNGQSTRSGQLDTTRDEIALKWPPVPGELRLRRVDPASPGIVPQHPKELPGYRIPSKKLDGWRTSAAKKAGFDEAALANLANALSSSDPFSDQASHIHSLLVARNGKLVFEEYFYGYDAETRHDLRSAGKTLASILLGATMRTQPDIAPGSSITRFIKPQSSATDRKGAITLGHLLTHTSGLDCDDNDDASPGHEGVMQSQSEQPDWWKYTIDLNVRHPPGTRYAYCSAGINLVGAAIVASTGESVPESFDRLIAQPLRFGTYSWNLMPNGEGYLGGGVHMRPRDMLKLGQLFLDQGMWAGERILSADWIKQSTSAHVTIDESSTGLETQKFAQIYTRGADGFAWHRYGVRFRGRTIETYEASGNGGQYLIVVPDYDLAVVITGGNYGQGNIWSKWRDRIVGDGVISAIKR